MDIIRILYDPVKVFRKREMEQGINPWILFGLIIIVSIIIFLLSLHHQYQFAVQKIMERIQQLPESQRKLALQHISYKKMLTTGLAAVIFMVPLKLLFQGLIFQQLFTIWGNIKSFSDSLYVVVYGNLISIYAQILKLVIEYTTGKPYVNFDLSLFVSKQNPLLYKVLSNVDIFTIWSLIVMGIGFSELARVKRSKSFTIVFALWIIYIAIIAFLFSMGGGKWLRF